MTPHAWLTFVGASIILLLIPGPTILMVIGDSMTHRSRSAWTTVAGVAVGDTTAMTLSLAGAGALLAASAVAFSILKSAGGLYLIYLGIQSIRKSRTLDEQTLPVSTAHCQTSLQRFLKAWAVTSLNPKSIVFFVAFVPAFELA